MPKLREARLDLASLTLASSQVYGSVRMVPLLRSGSLAPLRLHHQTIAQHTMVGLEGHAEDPSLAYYSYVPHAFILEAQGKGVAASCGTQLAKRRDGQRLAQGKVHLMHRMAKREDAQSLRFLPLHLAMEGFLALHFGGPDFMWPEYSRRALSRGLSPRTECTFSGYAIDGFDEALRTFEIHPTQCGVLVYVADSFANAFVVPHPQDYRALHRSLIEDMFSELLVRYGQLDTQVQASRVSLDASRVTSFEDLEHELGRVTRSWSEYEASLADGLFARPVHSEEVGRAGPFVLERFRTDMALGVENYLGERIQDAQGDLQYLKVLRLSEAQVRRAYLLRSLQAHAWHLDATASALGITRAALITRLEGADFGYLLREHVRREAERT